MSDKRNKWIGPVLGTGVVIILMFILVVSSRVPPEARIEMGRAFAAKKYPDCTVKEGLAYEIRPKQRANTTIVLECGGTEIEIHLRCFTECQSIK